MARQPTDSAAEESVQILSDDILDAVVGGAGTISPVVLDQILRNGPNLSPGQLPGNVLGDSPP